MTSSRRPTAPNAQYTFALGHRFIDNRCGEDVNAWVSKIKAQYSEVKSLIFDLDSLCVNVLLTGLPERFQAFVNTVWTAANSPTIDSVCDTILRINAGQQSCDSESDTLGNASQLETACSPCVRELRRPTRNPYSPTPRSGSARRVLST
jgi:hypothetical protein